MKSILNPSFKYTCSAETDVTKTFAKARKQIKDAQAAQKESEERRKDVVRQIKVRA